MSLDLRFDQKTRLVEALLGCAPMQTPERRATVLRNMPEAVRTTVVSSAVAREHVGNIVDRCLDYVGALEQLLAIVEADEQGSLPAQRLRQVAEELGIIAFIPGEQVGRLVALVAAHPPLPADALSSAYRRTLYPQIPAAGVPDTLGGMAADLARFGPHEARPALPLLEFAERLAGWADGSAGTRALGAALRGWVDETAAACARPAGEVEALRRRLARDAAEARAAYLIVYVDAVNLPNAAGRYAFRAWLWRGGDGGGAVQVGAPHASVDLEGLKAELRGLVLAASNEHRVAPSDLAIDVFLPFDLLSADVDQWLIQAGLGTRQVRVGVGHTLVVRSSERASNPGLLSELEKRWEALCRDPLARLGQNVHVVASDQPYDDDAFYTTLYGRGDISCVVVGPGAAAAPGLDAPQPLRTAVEAGTPVVVWLRRPPAGDPAALHQDVSGLIAGAELLHLPRSVRDARRVAAPQDPRSLGNYLSLLWDNPERLPPTIAKYSQPTTTGE